MAAPNENGTNTNTNMEIGAVGDSPGVLSKISNTFQGIKMPWNKDEQGVPQPAADATPTPPNDSATTNTNGNPNSDGQISPSMFSATMSKVSNTFSNIQMPWTNKDQQPAAALPAANDANPPAPGPSSPQPQPQPNDGNVITGAFSKMSNTISSIQMPWNNKTDQQKTDASGSPPDSAPETQINQATAATSACATGPEGNVLSNTFSKVTNTFSSMQMPWTSKSGESGSGSGSGSGSAQSSPPPDATAPATNGPASETSPLNKVTGFFTSVFRQSSTTQAGDTNAAGAGAAATATPVAASDGNAESAPKPE